MKNSRLGLLLMLVGGMVMLAVPAQAGIGAALARARNRIERFLMPDHIPGTAPSPTQPAAVAPPVAPENLHVVGRNGTELRLAWAAAVPATGRTIRGYEVRRNGVRIAQPAALEAVVEINPTGVALESFTVVAIDDHGVASPPSAAVVALRGQDVPFEFQRRIAFAREEGYVATEEGELVRTMSDGQVTAAAEAALVVATAQLPNLEWGGAFGRERDDTFLFWPLGAAMAARLYTGDGGDHSMQVLSQGEYRIRIARSAGAPPGPGFPVGGTGDPNAEMPVGATVPVRWAEALHPFEESEPVVLAVRSEELVITEEGAAGRLHFVPVPVQAGMVTLQLLPLLGEFRARPTAANQTPATVPDVLSTGQAAEIELFDPIGTDYLSGWVGETLVATVEGALGVVRILAIDPAVERDHGLDAAMADGIEIPSGVNFMAYVSPDGRGTVGRRLLLVGGVPGVAKVTLNFWNTPGLSVTRTVTVLPRIELAVDANRDGVLALGRENASDAVAEAEPYRFWVNDDDDAGETEGDDIPLGALARANFQNDVVDGARDLVDFFPVFVDVGESLQLLRDGPPVTVRLRQADGAVNFAYTKMDRDHATAHWRELWKEGFGDAFNRPPGEAETHRVTAEGVALSAAFLEGVRDSGKGVLLVEGRSPTLAPLVLEVVRSGEVLAEARLPLRLNNVEDMFRHVDLTKVAREYDGGEATLPEPVPAERLNDRGDAWPDYLTNGKYFVFVHGYNVDGLRARGWQSEVFKRLHVLGSRARFVGVTWHGATGLRVGDGYLDYHKAVFNALQAGDKLNDALKFTEGAEVTIAGHSLGNGVVAQAIQFRAFRPNHYIMINAALPVEAFDPAGVAEVVQKDMVEAQWVGYRPELQSANWFKLFEPSDERRKLTWQGRYDRLSELTNLHHFYSSGEEVLKNAEGVHSPSLIEWLVREHGSLSEGAWKMQELAKGLSPSTSLGTVVLSGTQVGWSFAVGWMVSSAGGRNTGISPRLRTSNETEDITPTELITRPFFGEFREHGLTSSDATTASEKAGRSEVLFDVLARAIPAKSYAAGANDVGSFGVRNYNMNTKGRAPEVISLPTSTKQWGHSDFKLLALPLSYPMYLELIGQGALK
jgi:hypothetical protein